VCLVRLFQEHVQSPSTCVLLNLREVQLHLTLATSEIYQVEVVHRDNFVTNITNHILYLITKPIVLLIMCVCCVLKNAQEVQIVMGVDAKILALNVLALLLLNERQIVLERKFADLDIICTQQPSFA
jgi:hypothetical protein